MCYSLFTTAILMGAISTCAAGQSVSQYNGYAELASERLLMWYNESTGIFDTTGWWNSANALTALADLAAIDAKVHSEVTDIFPHTLVAAQQYNMQMTKTISPKGLIQTFYAQRSPGIPTGVPIPAALTPTGFLNGFYDDEGWWALAWVATYDLTQNATYLSTAQSIFDDMAAAWTTPCGGIWWDRNHTAVNAIANELFLSVASHLANRVPADKQSYYLDWAEKEWKWFKASGMINADNNINDGLNLTTCKNNGQTVWTYNQGVVLGGLVELNRAAPDASYISTAHAIAVAGIHNLTDSSMILHDTCEPNCGADGGQFKGIFMRNLKILNGIDSQQDYRDLFVKNSDSIWSKDRSMTTNELSLLWNGPFVTPGNASLQSSALDALIAAAAT